MSKPQHDPVYARLLRELHALEAIPQAKRTTKQRQQHAQLEARVREHEEQMALGEVQG